jgi:MFS family permease
MTLNAVAAVLPVLMLQPLAHKFGAVKTHAWCIASMSAGYFALSFLGGQSMAIYMLMALLGVGWSATISLPFAIMSRKVEQSKMGLYMGLFNLSVVLPQLVASVGVGLIVNNAEDKNILFIICGVCLAISAVCWMGVKEEKLETLESGGGD